MKKSKRRGWKRGKMGTRKGKDIKQYERERKEGGSKGKETGT